jgi:hypothetical protein
MSTAPARKRRPIIIQVERDVTGEDAELFIELLCGEAKTDGHVGDMLIPGFSGHWLYGLAHTRTPDPAWLVCDRENMTQEQFDLACANTDALFEHLQQGNTYEDVYLMDRAAAIRALAYGVGRWGDRFLDGCCDYGDYDIAVQVALMGDLVYG